MPTARIGGIATNVSRRDVLPDSGLKGLRAGAAAFACAVAALAVVGCYNPHVQSGGLRCASTSPQCPDGFSCAVGVCVSSSGTGLGGAPGLGGAGGGEGAGGAGGSTVCTDQIVPLCTPVQMTSGCDPVCQTGCPCGLRCQVAVGGPKCVAPAGSLTAGMVCTPEADACAPGLTCLQEACGNDLGRCYRFCNGTCSGSGVCGTPVLLPDRSDSGQRVCDLSGQACDAYTGTGCVDPALICYALDPGVNTCDCPSGVNAPQGAACNVYSDCAVGLACLGIGPGGTQQCVKLCESAADCPTSTCAFFFGPTLGYCQL